MAKIITLKDNLTDETLYPQAVSASVRFPGGTDLLTSTINWQGFYVNDGSYYRATDGASVILENAHSTSFIPINPMREICLYTYLGKTGNYPQYGIAFFDSNFAFISGYNADNTETDAGMQEVLLSSDDIPESACFFTAMVPSDSHLANAYIFSGFDGAQINTNDYLKYHSHKEASSAQQFVVGLSNMSVIAGEIKSSYIERTSSVNDNFVAIRVTGGDVIEIAASISGAKLAILSDFDAPLSTVFYQLEFATGESSSRDITSGYSATLPSDAKYVLLRAHSATGNNYLPDSFKINGFEICTDIKSKFSEIENNNTAAKETFNDIQTELLGFTGMPLYYGDMNTTYILEDSTRSYSVIKIKGGEHIVSSSTPLGAFVFAKTYDFNCTLPYNYDFATGETTYHGLQNGYEGNAPEDARYILIRRFRNTGETDTTPDSFVIDGVDVAKSLRESVESQNNNNNILHNDSKFAYKGVAPAAFRDKLMMMEKDLTILLLGDSQTAFTDVGAEFDNAPNLPPGCQHNGITYKLWKTLAKVLPQCDRFDSEINEFTETGDFSLSSYEKQSTNDTTYGEFSKDNCVYRETATAADSVSFDWNLDDYEKLNFVGRMGPDGSKVITITCPSGKIKVVHNNRMNPKTGYSDGQLVEANGYTFTQWLDDSQTYKAHWLRNMPIRFVRAEGATGEITITITNTTSGGAGVMYYWGTERWNFNTIHVVNIGRGGRSTPLLYRSIGTELDYRDVDLLIYQLPMWNDIKAGGDIVETVNSRFDNIFDVIRTCSNNWQKFQLIINMYHTQAASWDGNNSLQFQANGVATNPKTKLPDWITCHQIFKHTASVNNANVVSCDLYNEAFNYATSNGLTMEQLLSSTNVNPDADESSGLDSVKFTIDGTHLSSYGFDFYAQLIEAMMIK